VSVRVDVRTWQACAGAAAKMAAQYMRELLGRVGEGGGEGEGAAFGNSGLDWLPIILTVGGTVGALEALRCIRVMANARDARAPRKLRV
jgi:hypothetical protein